METIFEGYEPVVGEKVIRYNLNLIGEIFKIHGSAEDPSSIVLTEADYKNYREKRKYISAKLLTYFSEHPVFIFGYGFNDPNVSDTIRDVGRIIAHDGRTIPNIFYVKWVPEDELGNDLREEYIIGEGDQQYRVRAIVANKFDWIYRSISQERELPPLNTKLLRSLAARTYNLIRRDIPRKKLEVDYGTLEGIASKEETLHRLLEIVPANNANMTHPYVLTQVGRHLGFNGWHRARALIERVQNEKGVNILDCDNKYHCHVKIGMKSKTHKYSKEIIELLKKVRDGEDYSVDV